MSSTLGQILIVFGFILIVFVYIVGKKNMDQYEEELELLKENKNFNGKKETKKSKKKSKSSESNTEEILSAFSLKIFDTLGYKNNSFFEKKIEFKFRKIYGKNFRKYFRVHMAKMFSMAVFLIAVFFIILGAYQISSDSSDVQIKGNKIIRPDIGDGERELGIEVNLKNGDSEEKSKVNLQIGEATYTEEELLGIIDKKINEKNILGNNNSLKEVKENIRLPYSFKGIDKDKYKIIWFSNDENIIEDNGKVNPPSKVEGNKTVNISSNLIRKEDNAVIWSKDFDVSVIAQEKNDTTSVESTIEDVEQSIEYAEKDITIPEQIGNYEIHWNVDKNYLKYIILTLLIIVGGVILAYLDLFSKTDKRIAMKKEHILYEFPEFLNKLLLLVNAGNNVKDAWLKISSEANKNNYFYELVRETAYDMREAGTSEVVAYEKFKEKCGVKEVSKFINTVKQNLRKGSSELADRLEELAKDCWSTRVNITKERGKQASTKLLLPMFIMLIAIMLIVGMPAVIQISG